MITTLQPKEGYETIRSWYVNLDIPDDARALLRKDIDAILRGEPSGNCILGIAAEIKKGRVDQESLIRHLQEAGYRDLSDLTEERIIDIAEMEALYRAESGQLHKGFVSFLGQHLMGSTPPNLIPPDPFVKIGSYFSRTIEDEYEDLRERVERNFYGNIDERGDFLNRKRPLARLGHKEQWKLRMSERETEGKGEAHYKVQLVINYKSREARIEPNMK